MNWQRKHSKPGMDTTTMPSVTSVTQKNTKSYVSLDFVIKRPIRPSLTSPRSPLSPIRLSNVGVRSLGSSRRT